MEGLDEWEVLPDGGFIDIHEDDTNFASLSDNLFKNYFPCPSPKTPSSSAPPPPIQLEDPPPTQYQHHQDDAEEQEKNIVTSQDLMIINPASEKFDDADDHQDPNLELFISSPKKQVFFFKKENLTEFVDMKLDLESPKSNNKLSRPSSPTQLMAHQFEAPVEEGPDDAEICSPKKMMIKSVVDDDVQNQGNLEDGDQNEGGGNMNNVLKWSLTGIGAICSFGVATVCIFVLGGLIKNSRPRNASKQYPRHHHQKLQFHIFGEDKRLKEASRLKEAISAMKDIPLNRAHITFGGYCDAH